MAFPLKMHWYRFLGVLLMKGNLGSGNGLVYSGIKLLSEPILTKIIKKCNAYLGHNEWIVIQHIYMSECVLLLFWNHGEIVICQHLCLRKVCNDFFWMAIAASICTSNFVSYHKFNIQLVTSICINGLVQHCILTSVSVIEILQTRNKPWIYI